MRLAPFRVNIYEHKALWIYMEERGAEQDNINLLLRGLIRALKLCISRSWRLIYLHRADTPHISASMHA